MAYEEGSLDIEFPEGGANATDLLLAYAAICENNPRHVEKMLRDYFPEELPITDREANIAARAVVALCDLIADLFPPNLPDPKGE